MRHPFIVGETYENNKGTYTVLSINLPKMHIQYENGSQATVTLEVQTRIWDRILTERLLAQEEQERQQRINRPSITFNGLEPSDFKNNVEGTTWRSRSSLGGLVSQQLSDKNQNEFISWAIYRRPHFFVYPPQVPMLNQQEGVKWPKFIVELNPDNLFYGFYIERADGAMSVDWRWPRYITMLSQSDWQEKIQQLMSELGLRWVLWSEEKNEATGTFQFADRKEISSFTNNSEFPSFSHFAHYLQHLPPGNWYNLYLGTTIAKAEAIDMKEKISNPITHAFNQMASMYFATLSK